MLEALRRTEDHDGLITNNTESKRLKYFKYVMNDEFVNAFMASMGDIHKLQEFVYAIDVLVEISRSRDFPSGRLLNNVDITQKAAFTLGQLARWTRDKSLFGCQVTPDTAELVDEFFSYNYPELFGEFFNKTKFPFAAFTLDGVWYQLMIVREFSALREYAAVKLISSQSDIAVYIPFLKSRLGL